MVLYVRVPAELHARVRAFAAADRRTVNAEAIVLLEEAVTVRLDELSPAEAEAIGLP